MRSNQREILFTSNEQARAVLGEVDSNLRYIEQQLPVLFYGHGLSLKARGENRYLAQAAHAIEYLKDLVAQGQTPSIVETQAALALFKKNVSAPASAAAAQTHSDKNKRAEESARPAAFLQTQHKKVFPRTASQKEFIKALLRCEITFGVGAAGTGKTYLSVAFALHLLQQGAVKKIIFCRPVLEAGEHLGFLPGDIKEKVAPYLRPLYDALFDLVPQQNAELYLHSGEIEIAPLAFMRGRSLNHSAIILDEAQNTTPEQMKMFLSRLGENSRMIIVGDPTQTDLPAKQPSGLEEALLVTKNIKAIAQITFPKEDIMRHPLVKEIIEAYDKNRKKIK